MMKEKIEKILTEKFKPTKLEVINESYKHAGHAGHDGSGESHFKVIINKEALSGNSRLEKHRAVIDALGNIMQQIHALNIEMN